MHYFNFFALGLACLVGVISAIASPKPTAKPIIAQKASIRGLEARALVTATANGCTAVCWDLYPGIECDVECDGSIPTSTAGLPVPTDLTGLNPSEVAHAVKRDDACTVTVTTIPAYCSSGTFPTQAAAALSKASAFLSSIALTPSGFPPISANATAASPGSAGFGPIIAPTAPISPATAPSSVSEAATSTSPSEQPTPISPLKGSGSVGRSLSGILILIMVGLLSHVILIV